MARWVYRGDKFKTIIIIVTGSGQISDGANVDWGCGDGVVNFYFSGDGVLHGWI